MIDYIHKDLYWQDSIDKQLKIELEDGTILDNSMIYSEEFELEESLCSEDELRFGACEASCVKFRIFSIPNRLAGQKITISEVLGGQTDSPMQIGKYKIASAKPTADRDFIDIVAYDVMYDIIHSDVAAWYNNQFKATTSTTTDEDGNETTVVTYSTTTLKKFRDSFFSHFGIEQVDVTLPNDNMVVSKTIEIVPNEYGTIGETLSGSVVIEAICELNGCFGHINRDGKFEYVTLKQIYKELFPADDLFPRNDLYPASDNVGLVIYNWQYEATEYEDFDVQPITQVQIIQEDNDIGMTVGADGNKYVVNSNFLTYSFSDEELETVGTNLLSVIEKAKYTPIKANVIGNPCVTVGDIIKIVTNSAILYSYVINRSLKGCQSLTDEFESNGEEYRSVDVNSTSGQIKKLQGRSNVLERSIDETRSTITNVEKGLKSEIKQTTDSITSEVERATSEEQKLSSKIEQTTDSITSTVAESTKQWDTVDSNGNAVSIKQSGYGFDGSISGGDSYVYSDSMVEDDIYLDQKLGYGWACKGTKVINGRRAALFGYRPRYVFKLITSNLSSEIKQTASSIESTVAESQSKWDTTNFPVPNATIKSGYGVPKVSMTGYNGYLDVSTGLEYYWGDDGTGTGNKKWAIVGKATEIKSDLETKITETASGITASVTEKLKNYSTTEEMESAISISKDSIESTVAKSVREWDTVDSHGNYVNIANRGYGIDGYITGSAYVFSDSLNVGDIYLDQITGYGWLCSSVSESEGKRIAVFGYRPEYVFSIKTDVLNTKIDQTAESIISSVSSSQSKWDTSEYKDKKLIYGYGEPNIIAPDSITYYLDVETGYVWYSYRQTSGYTWRKSDSPLKELKDVLESEIEQTSSQIVLKVDANGRIVEVSLTGDPKDGTEFTVDADNIFLTASDIIDIIANNSINLTSKKISIESTNFSVDEDGNMKCSGAEFSGTVKGGSVIGSTIYGDKDLYLYEAAYSFQKPPNYRNALSSGAVSQIAGTGNVLFVGTGYDAAYLPETVFLGYTNEYVVASQETNKLDGRRRISDIGLYNAIGSGTYLNFDSNGTTYAIAASASDTKLKEDIEKTEQTAIDKIRKIEFIQYKVKSSGTHVLLGVSANQLDEVIPQSVVNVPQGKDSEFETLKNVDTFVMLNYALKGIQEIDSVIKKQKQEIDTLKQQLATLTERMDRYEQGLQ